LTFYWPTSIFLTGVSIYIATGTFFILYYRTESQVPTDAFITR